EGLLDLVLDVGDGLAGDGAPLDDQGAPVGDGGGLGSAGDGGGVQEAGAEERVGGCAQFGVAGVQGCGHRRHAGDRVDAEVGPGAVGGDAVDRDLDPDESAVGNDDGELGGFEHDRGVGDRPTGVLAGVGVEDVADSEAGVFLVGDRGEQDVAGGSATDRFAHGDEGGRDPTFHVVGASTVHLVTLDVRNKPGLSDPNGVEMPAQQQAGRVGRCGAVSGDQQAGPAGGGVGPVGVEPCSCSPAGDQVGDGALTVRAADQGGVLGVDGDESEQEVL